MTNRIFLSASCIVVLVFQPVWGRAPSLKTEKKEERVQTVRAQADPKKLEWDIALKKKVYFSQLIELRKRGIPIDNDLQMLERLRKILNKLKSSALIPELPYELHYADAETVNAVCFSGGGIIFFRGLFDAEKGLVNKESDDEIAAVMSHEIAHATLRHVYKAQKKAKTINVIGVVVTTAISAAGGEKFSNLFASAYDVGTGLYFPHYSRELESAADLEGLYMMIDSGFNPQKAVEIWERAAAKKGKKTKTSIFASHPSDGSRAEILKLHLQNIVAGKGSGSAGMPE